MSHGSVVLLSFATPIAPLLPAYASKQEMEQLSTSPAAKPISSRGQISIANEIREQAGLGPGDCKGPFKDRNLHHTTVSIYAKSPRAA